MERCRLGSICKILSGGTPKTGVPEYWNGDRKWITPAELSESSYIVCDTDRKITEAGVKSAGLTPLPEGTVILSSRAPIGKVAIAGCEMYCNQGFKNLVCSEHIYNKYLYWYLKSKTDFLNSLGRGATFTEISKTTVSEIELDVPEYSEQVEKVIRLEKLQSIITHRRSQLAKLDELVKCRFVEMFGRFPDNSHSWKTGKIADVLEDIQYGTSSPAVKDGQFPYIRMSNISYDGELDLSEIKHIDASDEEVIKYGVRRGDVIFNRTNSKDLVGKTCVFDGDDIMILAGYNIRLRVNGHMLAGFLSAFLNADFSKQKLRSICKESISQANISATELKKLGIYIPPLSVQQTYIRMKEQLDKLRLAIQDSLAETQKLFDSLMQEYFD